jgi:hypothetical protein
MDGIQLWEYWGLGAWAALLDFFLYHDGQVWAVGRSILFALFCFIFVSLLLPPSLLLTYEEKLVWAADPEDSGAFK